MKLKTLLIGTLLLFLFYSSTNAGLLKEYKIVLEATLVQLGPDPKVTTGTILPVYRLAKYRVERVCKGKFNGEYINVDHIVMTGKEFDDVKLGDRLCIRITRERDIFPRETVEGIREDSDIVKFFYVGEHIEKVRVGSCTCTRK